MFCSSRFASLMPQSARSPQTSCALLTKRCGIDIFFFFLAVCFSPHHHTRRSFPSLPARSPAPPPPSALLPPISSPSTRLLLRFGEISAGNCESFTRRSHNGLWDYAKHRRLGPLAPIDRRQRRPLVRAGERRRALNEDATAITQVRLTDTLAVCSSSPPPSPLCGSVF